MNKIIIEPGTRLKFDGEYCVVLVCPPTYDKFVLRAGDTKKTFDCDDFHAARRNGRIEVVEPSFEMNLNAHGLNQELKPLYDAMLKLDVGQSNTKVKIANAQACKQTAFGRLVEAGDIIVPSNRTLLRHFKVLKKIKDGAQKSKSVRQSTFPPEAEHFYIETITKLYCDGQQRTPAQVHRNLKARCKTKELLIPSETYVRNKIKQLDVVDVYVSRKGKLRAVRHFRDYHQYELPTLAMQRVEFDAVHLFADISFHDVKYRKVIMFCALDICTRVICGISFLLCKTGKETESSPAALECLRSIITHKTKIDGIQTTWIGAGVPIEIVCDPGAAFNNKNLQSFCESLGITFTVTPSQKPDSKPFVERFFKTLRDRLGFKLPGYQRTRKTRGHDVLEKFSDSPAEYEDFRALVLDIILNDYHNSPHAGLENKTPIEAWQESGPGSISFLQNDAACDIFTGQREHGTIQLKRGIQINKLFYSSRELIVLRESLCALHPSKNPIVAFQFDVLDISKIIVTVPEELVERFGKRYLLVPSSARYKANTHLAEVRSVFNIDALPAPLYQPKPCDVDAAIERIESCLGTKRISQNGKSIEGVDASQAKLYLAKFLRDSEAFLSQSENEVTENEEPQVDSYEAFDGEDEQGGSNDD